MPLKLLYVLAFTLAPMAVAAELGRKDVVPRRLLVIGRMPRLGGGLAAIDPIEARLIAGSWTAPHAGDTVALSDGKSAAWEEIAASKDGEFENAALNGGYAYLAVPSDKATVAILEASGHSAVYVNGEPRMGDVYSDGIVRLPILLRKGENGLLFRGGRGTLKIRVRISPVLPLELNDSDTTLPDLHAGLPDHVWGAIVVVNATQHPQSDLAITATLPGGRKVVTSLPRIEALSVRKVGFRIEGGAGKPGAEKVRLQLELKGPGGHDSKALELRVRRPGQTYKQTFISQVDGSVQYFAVNPARSSAKWGQRPALVLSLHGASVQAIGQADAYGAKSWATLVAPTNRRPYGYDWEDWGRIDAMEVLDIAQHNTGVDSARTYLVGHSMGGHGSWQLGVLYPDRFAAIAPSAGWISAFTYAGGKKDDKPSAVQDILRRSGATMDTLSLVRNTASEGVYILHGTDDDNVPVTEARRMRDVLAEFHKDTIFHEEPKQGHWWDISDEPGADCVDWPPMWDFLAKHMLPPVASVRQVDFVTVNPGVSARCHWATIEAQQEIGRISRVDIRCDPQLRRFDGTTSNVSRLALSLEPLLPGRAISVTLDGQALQVMDPGNRKAIYLRREGGRWSFTSPAPSEWKGPNRNGPFRAAFDHGIQFVYGTGGTPEEAAWAFAKSRYDSETFWYRGNGSVDVLPDTAFDATKEKDRSVILYGNADTNRVWKALLASSPIQVREGNVRVGDREVAGDGLACLFLQPRLFSAVACVGVVSGTGITGMRMTNTLPYLQPMVGFPDLLVISTDEQTRGGEGVLAAGFFGPDWGVATGEFAWQDQKDAKP